MQGNIVAILQIEKFKWLKMEIKNKMIVFSHEIFYKYSIFLDINLMNLNSWVFKNKEKLGRKLKNFYK